VLTRKSGFGLLNKSHRYAKEARTTGKQQESQQVRVYSINDLVLGSASPSLGSQAGNPGLVSVIMRLGFSNKHKTSLLKNCLVSLRSCGISRAGTRSVSARCVTISLANKPQMTRPVSGNKPSRLQGHNVGS
jgi:hypothetical protein